AGGDDVQAAVAVYDRNLRAQEDEVGEAKLHAIVVVHVRPAVLAGVVDAFLGVVLEAGCLVAVKGYLRVLCVAGALRDGVFGESEAVVILAAIVLEDETLLIGGLDQLGAVCEKAVLYAVLHAVRVALEGGARIGLA